MVFFLAGKILLNWPGSRCRPRLRGAPEWHPTQQRQLALPGWVAQSPSRSPGPCPGPRAGILCCKPYRNLSAVLAIWLGLGRMWPGLYVTLTPNSRFPLSSLLVRLLLLVSCPNSTPTAGVWAGKRGRLPGVGRSELPPSPIGSQITHRVACPARHGSNFPERGSTEAQHERLRSET